MKDPILLNKLYREVDEGRVSVSHVGDLAIFKYTQDTHIKDLWNDVNRQARGIIFRADGTIVARPFEKFFNLHERSETHPNALPWKEGCEVYEKLDGSCGIGYRLDNHWVLATPGSMTSDQAIVGTKILHETIPPSSEEIDCFVNADPTIGLDIPRARKKYNLAALPLDCTPVFEIIYPENRVVVDYGKRRELVLLAIFEHNGVEWHPRRVDQIAELCGFRRPRRYEIDLKGEIPFEDNSEGYVARFGNGFRVKVKSPTYLRIHRILNHLSPKGVIELIRGREYGVTVSQLPPAIARSFDDVRAYVQGVRDNIITSAYEARRSLGALELASRKDQALWIQENVEPELRGFVFALLDEKEIEDKVWRLVLEKVKEDVA